jgi:hypothetical protein
VTTYAIIGIITMVCGMLLFIFGDSGVKSAIGGVCFMGGLVLFLVAMATDTAQTEHTSITQDLQRTYGDRVTVASYTNPQDGNGTDVGFDVRNAAGQSVIHCDGKLVTDQAGHKAIATESLTPACQTALAGARP